MWHTIVWVSATVTLILKKPNFNPNDLSSYQPVSNLLRKRRRKSDSRKNHPSPAATTHSPCAIPVELLSAPLGWDCFSMGGERLIIDLWSWHISILLAVFWHIGPSHFPPEPSHDFGLWCNWLYSYLPAILSSYSFTLFCKKSFSKFADT